MVTRMVFMVLTTPKAGPRGPAQSTPPRSLPLAPCLSPRLIPVQPRIRIPPRLHHRIAVLARALRRVPTRRGPDVVHPVGGRHEAKDGGGEGEKGELEGGGHNGRSRRILADAAAGVGETEQSDHSAARAIPDAEVPCVIDLGQ